MPASETETPAPPETPETPAPEQPVPEPPPGEMGTPRENERVREAIEKKNEAEKRAVEAEAKLKEREDAELTEKERIERERDTARKEADEAIARATRLEREGVARSHAAEAGFIDPSDAPALLDLEALDTDAKIRSAVNKLAEQKGHLVGKSPQGGFGHPGGANPIEEGPLPGPSAGGGGDGSDEDAARLGIGRGLLTHMRGQRPD